MPTSRTLQAWCPRCGGRIHEHTADWRCARCDFKLPAFRDGQRRDIEDIEREVQNILDEIAAAKGAPAEKPQPAPADPLDPRQTPENNIGPATDNGALARFEPAYALLKAIQESQDRPYRRLKRFKREFTRTLTALTGISTPSDPLFDTNTYSSLADSAAAVPRNISITAWNETELKSPPFLFVGDIVDSLQYARYPDLRKRLLADQKLFRRPGT